MKAAIPRSEFGIAAGMAAIPGEVFLVWQPYWGETIILNDHIINCLATRLVAITNTTRPAVSNKT